MASDDGLSERLCFLGDGVLTPTSSRAIIREDFGQMKEGCGKMGRGFRDSAERGELADFLLKKSLSSRWDRCEFAIVPKMWESRIKMVFRKMCKEGDWEPSGSCACRNRSSLHKPAYEARWLI